MASLQPRLSLPRIIEMNLGFLGLQFSFGLQQGNMGPIYSYLGAEESQLPLLTLAGPVTGLIVQPFIGALSDRTVSPLGQRTPYFLIGAMLCSFVLLAMPHSISLWMAASLLWILDAGNNITMEPYRAYVADRLSADQRHVGFLTQSAFTGLAQMLAFLTPSVLVACGMDRDLVNTNGIPLTVHVVFVVGAVLSLSTMIWTIWRVPELPLPLQVRTMLSAQLTGPGAMLSEIGSAIKEMPDAMRRLAVMCFFQWFAMAGYWAYVIYSIGRCVYGTSDPSSSAYRTAVLTNGEMAAFYNLIAFVSAFAFVPVARRFGPARLHAFCLCAGAGAMLVLPHVTNKALLFLPALGMGIAWGSIMGNPYTLLANAIPAHRTGVYMGIFNMMIVMPMMIFAGFASLTYDSVFSGDPRNILTMSGIMMGIAAMAVLRVRDVSEQQRLA